MGTDYLKRFDLVLASDVGAMDADGLAAFLSSRFDAWRRSGRPAFSEALYIAGGAGTPMRDAVQELLASGSTLDELRNDAVFDFCLEGDDLRLDYWGCYPEVFAGEPEGAVSSLELLPGSEEERFLVLRPAHVAEILRSLREHAHELTVMSPAAIEAVAKLSDAAETGHPVAYCFDF